MKKVILAAILWSISIAGLFAQEDGLSIKLLEIPRDSLLEIKVQQEKAIMVSAASKKSQKIQDAPNVVHVVSKEQILTRGYMNLRDVFADIPGINTLFNSLLYGSQVRGIAPNDNEKVSLLINGVFITSVTEENYLTDLINLNDVEKIEIIIGPGAVLYGAQSLVAMINIFTKEINGSEVTLSGGSNAYNSITASVGKKAGDFSFFISGSRVQTDGWDAWANSSPSFDNLKGTSLTGQLHPSYSILGRAKYKNWELQFNTINSSIPELYIHNSNKEVAGNRDDYQNIFNIKNTKKWTQSTYTILEATYASNRILRAVTENQNAFNGVQQSFDLTQNQYGLNYSLVVNKNGHYFQTGVQLSLFENNHNYSFTWRPNSSTDSLTAVQSIVEIGNTHGVGFYASDDYQVSDKLNITLAARADYNSILENSKVYISPRAAIVYTPNDFSVFKLLYNKATRMPRPWMSPKNELWNVNKDNAPSWLLNPTAERPEILTAYEFQTVFSFEKTQFSFNLYYQELQDFIAWYAPFTNVGDFDGFGGEFTANYLVNENMKLWLNGSYNEASFEQQAISNDALGAPKTVVNPDGVAMSVPKFTSTIGFDLKLGNYHFTPRINYYTNIPAFDGSTDRNGDGLIDIADNNYFEIRNRTYFNATLTRRNLFNKKIDIQLIGKNILDNEGELPMQFAAMTYNPQGRSVFIRLQVGF